MSSFNPDILLNIYPRYMHLRVFVDENPELYIDKDGKEKESEFIEYGTDPTNKY